jgi:hypothetical protein
MSYPNFAPRFFYDHFAPHFFIYSNFAPHDILHFFLNKSTKPFFNLKINVDTKHMELFSLAWFWLSMIIKDKILPFCPYIFLFLLFIFNWLLALQETFSKSNFNSIFFHSWSTNTSHNHNSFMHILFLHIYFILYIICFNFCFIPQMKKNPKRNNFSNHFSYTSP